MLQWYQIFMTFEESKTMLVPFESLGDALQHRMFENERLVAKRTA